jgi:Protein of Unknown function (DUF2784)
VEYRLLASVVVVVHYGVLGYIVGGGFLALRWRWTIWTHLAACAWGVAIVTVPSLECPLTALQNWAAHRGGEAEYAGGFINRYVENVIYPARFTPAVQLIVGLAVLGSWLLFYRRRDRDSHRAGDLRRV